MMTLPHTEQPLILTSEDYDGVEDLRHFATYCGCGGYWDQVRDQCTRVSP